MVAHVPKCLSLRLAGQRVPGVVDQREDAPVAHGREARHDCRLPVRISGRRGEFHNGSRAGKRVVIARLHQLRRVESSC